MRMPSWSAAALLVLPSPGSSQPTLAALWPNPDGMRWDYQITATNSPDPSACPPEWVAHLGESLQTLALSLTRMPVAIAQKSWSQVKALYN